MHPEASVLKLRCSRLPDINEAKTKGIITTRHVSFEVAVPDDGRSRGRKHRGLS
jgi:hypothetical protein